MKLYSIMGNSQRLDGGSMFGNAPRAVWERWLAPDDLHRVPLACRAMLIDDLDGKTVLFETGIGAFFPPHLKERYGVVEDRHVLLDSLAQAGFGHEDIDVVVLSHLHFDHAGGLLESWQEGQAPGLLFPNATYVVGDEALERARNPHPRDRASFIPELLMLLDQSGRMEVVTGEHADCLGDSVRFHHSNGHTPGMLLAEVAGAVIFLADLIPGQPWVHIPITMGYDRYPEMLIDEKAKLLPDLLERGVRVFFTHDPEVAVARLARNDKGRFMAVDGLAEAQGIELRAER